MKNTVPLFVLFILVTVSVGAQSGLVISVSTQHTELILKVGEDGRLYQDYFGAKLTRTGDEKSLPRPVHLAYVTSGTDNLFEPAIRMTHNDGNLRSN
jgi:alpha-galactosidase